MKYYKKIRKKAAIGKALSDIYQYILVGFLMTIIIVLTFGIRSCSSEEMKSEILKASIKNSDTDYTLLNILRSDVIYDINRGIPQLPVVLHKSSMYDLIVLNSINNSYENILKNNIKEIIKSRYSSCVIMCIDSKKLLFNDCILYEPRCSEENFIDIPTKKEDIRISLNTNPIPLATNI